MEDAARVAPLDGRQHLAEEVARHVLGEVARLRDVVEEVLAVVHPLQDQEEAVGQLEEVNQPDDAGHVGHGAHEGDLERDVLGGLLVEVHGDDLGLGDELDGDGEAVGDALAGVDGAEAALAQHGAQRVEAGELARAHHRAAGGMAVAAACVGLCKGREE